MFPRKFFLFSLCVVCDVRLTELTAQNVTKSRSIFIELRPICMQFYISLDFIDACERTKHHSLCMCFSLIFLPFFFAQLQMSVKQIKQIINSLAT